MKRFLLIAMIAFLATAFNSSVEGQYKIVNYTDMNQINSLTEDGDYIWISTSGGAFKRRKSDGSLVKVINTDNSGIQRNAVNTMFIDFFGNYWFGTRNGGISKFDGNTWTTYTYLDSTWVNYCEAITSDLNGDLWFGVNGGVLRFKDNQWQFFSFGGYRAVSSIVADDMGNIWASIAGVNGAGLWKIDVNYVVQKISGPGNYFDVTSAPYCLHKDNNNNIWMGTWGGLFKYNNTSGVWSDYTSSISTVHAITQDNLGNLWMGTEVGVVKYDGISFGAAIGSGRTGFNENLVVDLMSDSQGKIWIGSYKGFAQLNQAGNAWTTPILMNALPSNYTETVVFDSSNKAFVYGQFDNTLTFDGSIWNSITNNSGTGFYWPRQAVIDGADNKFIATPGADKKLKVFKLTGANTTMYSHTDVLTFTYSNEVVNEMKYDPLADRIWIATNQGLFSVKSNGTSWLRFVQTPGALRSSNVKGIAINGTKVWYSTADNGIGYYDQSNGSWVGYSETEGLPWNTAGEMVFDKENTLWLICNGLTKFNGISFENFTGSGVSPTDIACDLQGNIWVGGYGGVAKFRNGEFRKYSTADGMIEDNVGDIVVDRANNMWVTTSYSGMTKLVPQTPVADFSSNIACLPGTTELTDLSTKTDDLTSYEWDINNDGSVDYTSKDVSMIFPSKGSYTVKLTVSNDDLSSEIIKQVTVLEAPDVSLNVEGDQNICFGESKDVQVIINNQDPLLIYQVEWSNGINGTQQVFLSEEGQYFATVNNGQCETQSPSLNLLINKPFEQEKICMVTVDVESGKNLIVWERTPDAGVESYNVYKLFGNSYVPIGNVSAYDISEYIDYTSSPDALAARYAISSIDTCGNESEKSAYHQTIYLGASEGIKPNTVVLDWTNYIDEAKIWQPEWYYVYRGNTPESLVLLDSISSAFTEWTDNDPQDSRYYQVLIKKSNPCTPKEYNAKKGTSKGGPYVHSLSNLEDNRLQSTGINNANTTSQISVYPNPFINETTIRWANSDNQAYSLKMYDLRGSLIREVDTILGSEYHLSRENLESGVYLLELSGSKLFKVRLFVQ